jgi:hypothetical protein
MKIKNINKNIILVVLSSTIALTSLTGCTVEIKDEPKSELPVITVTENYKKTNYGFVLDYNGVNSKELSDKYSSSEPLDLLTLTSHKTYKYVGNNDINAGDAIKDPAYFASNLNIIWPECYKYSEKSFPEIFMFTNSQIDEYTFHSMKGNDFVLKTCKVSFKSDVPNEIDLQNVNDNSNGYYRSLKTGDEFKSETLLYNGDVIAYKQTGSGIDSLNVVEEGNFDIALRTISDFGITENEEITSKESLNTLDKLNSEYPITPNELLKSPNDLNNKELKLSLNSK